MASKHNPRFFPTSDIYLLLFHSPHFVRMFISFWCYSFFSFTNCYSACIRFTLWEILLDCQFLPNQFQVFSFAETDWCVISKYLTILSGCIFKIFRQSSKHAYWVNVVTEIVHVLRRRYSRHKTWSWELMRKENIIYSAQVRS